VVSLGGFDVPAYCHSCGKPYPWTAARIDAAKELSDELDGLTAEEKEQLKKSIDDIVVDTPRTTVAATRFKRLASKAGKGAVDSFKSILISVLSEAAKKILFPGP
jgi:hypothetical protein